MFGGFSGGVPHKPNESQKPFGVLPTPEANPKAPQKPLGVVQAPLAAPRGRQGTLGVVPGPGQVVLPPDAPGGHLKASQVEAEWTGVFHGWSGYSKCNREVLKRAAVYSKIRISDDSHWDPKEPSPEIQALYKFHRSLEVSPQAPKITFLPPTKFQQTGYRIIYTMMETEPLVHKDLIALMNEQWDECWTPSHWNHGTFERSGLKIPVFVMPLGVDPGIYSPSVKPALPKAMLMTGKDAGKYQQPSGFLFINVFQPTFRKGYDVLVKTFEETFKNDPDVGLILGTTAYSLPHDEFPWKSMKSRIWALNATYTEKQLATIYKACKVYVCTSRGEGWNMSLGESAAVGLPVIVPRTSVHPELVPEGCGYFFEKDSDRVFPEGRGLSPYFDGIKFPDYGQKSQKQLSELMIHVKKNYREAQEKAQKLRAHMVAKYTWAMAARKVADRIRAICAR